MASTRELVDALAVCCDEHAPIEVQLARGMKACGVAADEIAARLFASEADVRAWLEPNGAPVIALPACIDTMCRVLYLVFTTGYATMSARGDALCDQSISLARALREEHPDPTVDALLALMLLHHARRRARVDRDGELVPLAEQDRTLWDHRLVAEARSLIARDMTPQSTSFMLQARIATLHAEAPSADATDWHAIAHLYGRLCVIDPSPIVALNGAIAVSMAVGPAAALPIVDALSEQLSSYHLWHAARAHLLLRLGRENDALQSYRKARELANDEHERRFLDRRIAELVRFRD